MHSITAETLFYSLSFTLRRSQELVLSFPSTFCALVVLCLMFQMEEIRGLAATDSGKAPTLDISRY